MPSDFSDILGGTGIQVGCSGQTPMGTSPSGTNLPHMAWRKPQAVGYLSMCAPSARDLVFHCSLSFYSVMFLQTSAVTALGEEHEAAEPAGEQ